MPRVVVYVLRGDRGWRVALGISRQARSEHSTQAEARRAAHEIADRAGGEVLVYTRDRSIRWRSRQF
jgi:Uncharacterized protein conserved in bacteria (DUF2188)